MLARAAVTPISQEDGAPRAFRPGIPALDAFPRELWARLAARLYRYSSTACWPSATRPAIRNCGGPLLSICAPRAA
jgi:hypothetical protein